MKICTVASALVFFPDVFTSCYLDIHWPLTSPPHLAIESFLLRSFRRFPGCFQLGPPDKRQAFVLFRFLLDLMLMPLILALERFHIPLFCLRVLQEGQSFFSFLAFKISSQHLGHGPRPPPPPCPVPRHQGDFPPVPPEESDCF